MRDPERIDRVIEALRQAWHRHPDWRLNQLLINASDVPYDCDKPYECGLGLVYYIEDALMEKRLRGIGTSQTLPPEMNCRSLAQAIVEAAAFLELSTDDVINPDSAVQALESISHSLKSASDTEKKALLDYCREQAAKLGEAGGEDMQKRKDFYEQFEDAMGLGDA